MTSFPKKQQHYGRRNAQVLTSRQSEWRCTCNHVKTNSFAVGGGMWHMICMWTPVLATAGTVPEYPEISHPDDRVLCRITCCVCGWVGGGGVCMCVLWGKGVGVVCVCLCVCVSVCLSVSLYLSWKCIISFVLSPFTVDKIRWDGRRPICMLKRQKTKKKSFLAVSPSSVDKIWWAMAWGVHLAC
jgi:hypothetical protein